MTNNSNKNNQQNNSNQEPSKSKTIRSFIVGGTISSLAYSEAIQVAKLEDRVTTMSMSALPDVRMGGVKMAAKINGALIQLDDSLAAIKKEMNAISNNSRPGARSKAANQKQAKPKAKAKAKPKANVTTTKGKKAPVTAKASSKKTASKAAPAKIAAAS
jgi:hypothetical protein